MCRTRPDQSWLRSRLPRWTRHSRQLSPGPPWRCESVTKGAGSRAAALAMVFKLVESAQARWRAVNAPHLVALVHAGARFERGQLLERSQTTAA